MTIDEIMTELRELLAQARRARPWDYGICGSEEATIAMAAVNHVEALMDEIERLRTELAEYEWLHAPPTEEELKAINEGLKGPLEPL